MKKFFKCLTAMTLLMSMAGCQSSGTPAKQETPAPAAQSENDITTDVVVVGGGGAGIASALSASQNGANVVLIEKLGYLGGATMMSGGIIPAVGTKEQQEAGIEDNNDWFARDILRPSNYSVRKDLVYTVVEQSKPLIEWMEGFGCKFSVITGSLFYGQSNYRMHLSEGSGAGMTQTLIDYLNNVENITVLLSTEGTGLLTNENGEVIGVTAKDKDKEFNIYANNTVLATSGFAANPDMIEEYIPEMAYAYKLVAPGATGEGILWGEELGAAVANMKAYQGHAFYSEKLGKSVAQSMADNGGIFVNANGVRFTNEYGGYSELSPHVLAQPGHFAYLVVNQEIVDKTAAWPTYEEAGIVYEGKTASELAAALGVDEVALTKTFEGYSASIERGLDEFNKCKFPASWTGPYYAVKITGDLRHTQGGLVTDVAAHVLREDGTVIQGLYAAGGCTEGFASTGGAAYMSGDGLLQALVFGRIAGEKAATEEKGNVEAVVYEVKEPEVVVSPAFEKPAEVTAPESYKDGEYEGEGTGNNGPIKVKVTVADGKIASVEVVEQAETPAMYSTAEGPVTEAIVENNGTAGVDTVSGATNSSKGILEAVDNALADAAE